MLPEVWDCAVRVLTELVDGPWGFHFGSYANAIPLEGQSALTVATLRPSRPPILCWKSSGPGAHVVGPIAIEQREGEQENRT